MATISATKPVDVRIDAEDAVNGLRQCVLRHARDSQLEYSSADEKLRQAFDAREKLLKTADLTLRAKSPWYLRYEVSYRLSKTLAQMAELTAKKATISEKDSAQLIEMSSEVQNLAKLLDAKNDTDLEDSGLDDKKLRSLAQAVRSAEEDIKSAHRELADYPAILLPFVEKCQRDADQSCEKLEAARQDLEQFLAEEVEHSFVPTDRLYP